MSRVDGRATWPAPSSAPVSWAASPADEGLGWAGHPRKQGAAWGSVPCGAGCLLCPACCQPQPHAGCCGGPTRAEVSAVIVFSVAQDE